MDYANTLLTLGYTTQDQLNTISEIIKKRITDFSPVAEVRNEGTIVSLKDGIVKRARHNFHALVVTMQLKKLGVYNLSKVALILQVK